MVTNKEKNFISIIVYVYNCENRIVHFLEMIDKQISNHFDSYEIICVNDCSTDHSIDCIKEYAKRSMSPVINIINMSYYQGIEASMNAGVDLAIGDFIYEFDVVYIDYDPKLVIDIYQKTQGGYDIVTAANVKAKRFATTIFYNLFNSNFHNSNRLQNETFRILSRRAINRIKAMSDTYIYRKAMYATCGLKSSTITYTPVQIGSTMKTKTIEITRKNLAINSLLLFTDVAYKFCIAFAMIMLVNFVGGFVYSLILHFLHAEEANFMPVLLIVSIGFAGLFSIGAIIIKYLLLIIQLVYLKQNYIYDSIDKVKADR